MIAALLHSPLHGVLSRYVLLLTYRGRKTGRRYTLPLSYVALGEHLYCCTRPAESRWWRNLCAPAAVTIRRRGASLEAIAQRVDPQSSEARDALRRFIEVNPRTGALLYHVQSSGGRPSEDDLRREVERSVVVRIAPAVA